MELEKILKIYGTIRLVSGLHIGAGKDAVEIGGLDNPIIKNPLSNAPYIPGSSLKGKMRSLLEARLMGGRSKMRESILENPKTKGKPCQCGEKDCPVCIIFGVSGSVDSSSDLGPTRILVRDANLSDKDKERFQKGELPMEIKYENSIDRRTGVANPRPIERTPAGVTFGLNIAFRVYKGDKPELLEWVFRALKLLELDALGGGGSRGNGEVAFDNIEVDDNGEIKKIKLDSINF